MKKIIIKYLNNSVSVEELVTLKTWLEKPKNQEKFKEYVRLNNELNTSLLHVEVPPAYQKVLERILKTRTIPLKPITNMLKYAAVVMGLSLISYGVYDHFKKATPISKTSEITLELEDGTIKIVEGNQNRIIKNGSGLINSEQKNRQLIYTDTAAVDILKYNTLKVPFGKTFGVVLSDGSKVTLNAGSELKYPVQFSANEKNRMVFLKGEAFFEVEKNTNHPFIVNTRDMDVKVLGTQFNITSYPDDAKAYTVLVEGRVEAQNKLNTSDTKILNPNERVFFIKNQLEIEPVNVRKYVSWVNGELVFIDENFKVIKNKLERKYNVTINNLYPELDTIIITARFKNETIEQVLKTFQIYKPFKYTIKEGLITISKPK